MAEPDGAFEYKAFISYSHRDTPWAKWLLQALETYRLPAALRAPLGRARGVGRIFRDRDEASAASDLKEEIQRALLASEHLIIIASPRSAKSLYVQAEIEAFAQANKTRAVPGHILTLIVDGEPNAGDSERECFPPALRGELRKADGSAFEPLAADARPTGDGRTRALAKLAAALLNVRYDTLVRRDLQRQLRLRLIMAATAVGALAIAGIVASVVITGNLEQERLLREREAAERDTRTITAINDALRAKQLFDEGDVRGAVELARQSLPNDGSIPFIPQAYSVLYQSQIKSGGERSVAVGHASLRDMSTERLADGSFISVTPDGTAVVWSPDRGVISRRSDSAMEAPLSVTPSGDAAFISVSGSGVVARYNTEAATWDVFSVNGAGLSTRTLVALDRDRIALCSVSEVILFDLQPGSAEAPDRGWRSALPGAELCMGLSLSDNGNVLANSTNGIHELAAADGTNLQSFPTQSIMSEVFYTDDRHLIASGALGTEVFDRKNGTLKLSFGEIQNRRLISPGGRFVVGSDSSGEIEIHDLDGQQPPRALDCSIFSCLAGGFLDETHFALTPDGLAVQVYDAVSAQMVRDAYRFSTAVRDLTYVPEDRLLLGWQRSQDVAIVSLGDTRYDPVFAENASPEGIGVEFDLIDPSTVVTGLISVGDNDSYAAGLLRRSGENPRASQTGDLLMFNERPHTQRITDEIFAVTHYDDRTTLYDAATGAELFVTDVQSPPEPMGSGRYLAINREEATHLREVATGRIEPLYVDDARRTQGQALWVLSESLVLVAGEAESRVFRVDGETISELASLRIPAEVDEACMTDDGTHLYIVTRDRRLRALVLDGETVVETILAPESDEARNVFSFADLQTAESRCTPDGIVINGNSSTSARAVAWDVSAGTVRVDTGYSEEWWRPGDPEAGLDVVVNTNAVRVVDLVTREVRATLSTGKNVIQTALLVPARNIVAAGLQDGTLMVWDLGSPEAPIIEVLAGADTITNLDATPGGTMLLTADDDDAVSLWPLYTVAEMLERTAPN